MHQQFITCIHNSSTFLANRIDYKSYLHEVLKQQSVSIGNLIRTGHIWLDFFEKNPSFEGTLWFGYLDD